MICSSLDFLGHKRFEHLVELNQSLVFALKLVLAADIAMMTALTSTTVGQAPDKSCIKPTNAFFTNSES